jgi:molecular chaperone DnaK (HSP70)
VDVFAADEGRLAAHGLRYAAAEALDTLRSASQAAISLDHGGGFGRDLATVVTRSQADQWMAPLMSRIVALCKRGLAQSGLAAHEIDAVLLVGDWAELPTVRETVADAFERPVSLLHGEDAAGSSVALGAALAANTQHTLVWDVTPYALGINCYYGDEELFSPIVRANTLIPTPPYGAGGAFTEKYETRFADQTSVTLDVLQYRGWRDPNPQGRERVHPNECERLGSWRFDGLQPKKGKRAAFTVTFAVNESGILELAARETLTGRTLTARVDRTIG